MSSSLLFSTFEVSKQVFFRTATTAAIVNLKPLVPGRSSCFSPLVPVAAVQQAYKADGLTIACQDGEAAGQSVPHVHIHIIPRKAVGDRFSQNDEIYPELEKHEVHMLGYINGSNGAEGPTVDVHPNSALETKAHGVEGKGRGSDRGSFAVDDALRKPRSAEDMEREAAWLTGLVPPPPEDIDE
ncbi:hypothetical protein PIIN_02790 [Serendipita indica DSM 11827]|uniref:HIT domain-containing protein n=1 Tax=Serendipita indica (strain DSM 11827) TaxID=1109443 RepID=G4TCA4_SERID|nr:hypothetical protein PIIN_02790 [Serendipita indica DSM 11827]